MCHFLARQWTLNRAGSWNRNTVIKWNVWLDITGSRFILWAYKSLQIILNYFTNDFIVNQWSIDSNLALDKGSRKREVSWNYVHSEGYWKMSKVKVFQSFLTRQVKKGQKVVAIVLSEEKIEFFRKFNWWHDIIYRHISSFSSWSWNTRITAFICITLFLLWASFLFCFIQNFQSSNS